MDLLKPWAIRPLMLAAVAGIDTEETPGVEGGTGVGRGGSEAGNVETVGAITVGIEPIVNDGLVCAFGDRGLIGPGQEGGFQKPRLRGRRFDRDALLDHRGDVVRRRRAQTSVFSHYVGVDVPDIHAAMLTEHVPKAGTVEHRAGTENAMTWPSRSFKRGVGQDVHGVGHDHDHRLRTGGHDLIHDLVHNENVAI